jgi:hypothetical protein
VIHILKTAVCSARDIDFEGKTCRRIGERGDPAIGTAKYVGGGSV